MARSGRKDVFEAAHSATDTHILQAVVQTYQAILSSFSRRVGMPASRFELMRRLALADREVGVMDLARQLGINAAAVTRQVKDMEAGGLVLRSADAKDGRRSYVRLSPRGLKLLAELHGRSHDLERSVTALVSQDDVRAAARVLAAVRERLSDSTSR